MAGKSEAYRNEHHAFMVFLGSQQFTFVSFEIAIEALDRSGFISEYGTARDVLERRAVPSYGEMVETWP